MKPVRYETKSGSLLVRDNFVLAFFCKWPFYEIVGDVGRIFEHWLNLIPADNLHWVVSGATAVEASRLDEKKLNKCKNMLDPRNAQKRKMTYFSVFGKRDHNPSYQFKVSADNRIERENPDNPETNLVEMRFSSEFVEQLGGMTFVRLIIPMIGNLPFDSGYGSLALSWLAESRLAEASKIMVPIALRYPGFDLHYNMATQYDLDKKTRGARWLTFLGPEQVAACGGLREMKREFTEGVSVLNAGEGIAVVAGENPETGDLEKGEDLPLIKSVASVIEKVTFFEDSNLESHIFDDDEEILEKWERRFL